MSDKEAKTSTQRNRCITSASTSRKAGTAKKARLGKRLAGALEEASEESSEEDDPPTVCHICQSLVEY